MKNKRGSPTCVSVLENSDLKTKGSFGEKTDYKHILDPYVYITLLFCEADVETKRRICQMHTILF